MLVICMARNQDHSELMTNLDKDDTIKALLWLGWVYKDIAAKLDVSTGKVAKHNKELKKGVAHTPGEIYQHVSNLNKQVFEGDYNFKELSNLLDTIDELPTITVFPTHSETNLSLIELVEIADLAEDYYEASEGTIQAARMLAKDIDRREILENAIEEKEGSIPPSMSEILPWNKAQIDEGRTMSEAVKQKGELMS